MTSWASSGFTSTRSSEAGDGLRRPRRAVTLTLGYTPVDPQPNLSCPDRSASKRASRLWRRVRRRHSRDSTGSSAGGSAMHPSGSTGRACSVAISRNGPPNVSNVETTIRYIPVCGNTNVIRESHRPAPSSSSSQGSSPGPSTISMRRTRPRPTSTEKGCPAFPSTAPGPGAATLHAPPGRGASGRKGIESAQDRHSPWPHANPRLRRS